MNSRRSHVLASDALMLTFNFWRQGENPNPVLAVYEKVQCELIYENIIKGRVGMIFAEIKVKHKARKAGRFSCLAIRRGKIQGSLKLQFLNTTSRKKPDTAYFVRD